jgi:site-specific DNA recombinase
MRAVIYARVSTLLQAHEDKVSIPEQIADAEVYARERGYEVVQHYIDKDRYKSRGKLVDPSGTRSDRPAYQEMLVAGHAGEFDIIIAWKEDRLYRGIRAAMPLGELLDEHGDDGKPKVRVELVKENFDPKMLFLKASLGKIEIDNFRERSSMGFRGRLKKGLSLGGTHPFGYDRIEGKLVVNESEAEWVRKLFWWYGVERVELTEIRRRFVENKVPQKGRQKIKIPWSKNIFYRMLKATYYYGTVSINAVGQKWELDCPTVVEKWIWDKAQERIKAAKSYPVRHYKEIHLLGGLIFCGVCGHRMQGKHGYSGPKHDPDRYLRRLYYCHAAWQYPDMFSCKRNFGARKVERTVWGLISNALEHPDLIREQVEAKAREMEKETEHVQDRVVSLTRNLQTIQEERQWLIVQARKKIITEAEFETQINLLAEQRDAVERELQDLRQATTQRDEAERIIAFAAEFFSSLRDGLAYLNQPDKGLSDEEKRKIAEEKRKVIEMLVTRIELNQEGHIKIEGLLDKNIVTANIKSPQH